MFKRAHLTADEIIRRNFRNSQGNQFSAIGIYPLRDGNLTRFIAMDFDSASWENDARCILKTARSIGIPMLWEISCSGNGAHLWIFFSEDIQASKARKLAFCIIDKTRERYPSLTMDSYDRLFPSQDRLSKDGIGNLILMPLISSAAVHGRTVFLDDNQIPIPLDRQLQYLARVHKLSAVEVDAYLSAAKAGCMVVISSFQMMILILDGYGISQSWKVMILSERLFCICLPVSVLTNDVSVPELRKHYEGFQQFITPNIISMLPDMMDIEAPYVPGFHCTKRMIGY